MQRTTKRSTPPTKRDLTRLKQIIKAPIEIAIDSEFQGVHTLSVQAATRTNFENLVVQVYRSPSVPDYSSDFRIKHYLPPTDYGRFCSRIRRRRIAVLSTRLSPVRLFSQIFDFKSLKPISRFKGDQMVQNSSLQLIGAEWDKAKKRWKLPKIKITLIGHFLTADFGRIFGTDFYADLFAGDGTKPSPVVFNGSRNLMFVEQYSTFANTSPVIEYAAWGRRLYEVHVETRDTMLPFGGASLERHSRTFLGIGKHDALSDDDKKQMRKVFETRPDDAYGYCIGDAINTLLISEEMQKRHREIFETFGVPAAEIPAMAATVGNRVKDFLKAVTKQHAKESVQLSKPRKLKELMQGGGMLPFHGPHAISRFGPQTGVIHGGLLYSRTPTTFWHHAPRMLRDVDFNSCYNAILGRISVYWGRPIVLEPGKRNMPLVDAVTYVRRRSNDDAWFVRVTGDISAIPNSLIPSTLGAIRRENYRIEVRRSQLAAFRQRLDGDEEKDGAKLFTRRIESGIVTQATWLMIQSLPENARKEYEHLQVDSIVYYPRRLVANDGTDFDQRFEQSHSRDLPWESEIDEDSRQLLHREDLDHEYVSLRFPIAEVAKRMGEERARAKQSHGKGSGQELAWKLQANTMFGVLACPHYETCNVVAANQITAYARAEAYALMLALNGLQVITDGCSYQRDRIPAFTFAECLAAMPDYPLRHADENSGISFLDPKEIPDDGEQFTAWYRQHVKRFFGVEGEGYDALFMTHALEHKQTGDTGGISFDAMACDGSGNYLKLSATDDGWYVNESKMRGYGKESKAKLQQWIIEAYSCDHMTKLAPITADKVLLKLKPAQQKAKKALVEGEIPKVYLPLGFEADTIRNFKVMKPSAFVFQTPQQWKAIQRQVEKFQRATECGLDLLVLRRSHGKRSQYSITAVAKDLYEYIQSGGRDLTKKFNLRVDRLSEDMQRLIEQRKRQIGRRKYRADKKLFDLIDIRCLDDDDALLTGIIVAADQIHLVT